MHPAESVVETLIHEELAPRGGTVGVEALGAHGVQLGAKIKRRVRVDEQQRVTGRAFGRGDGEAVGALRLEGCGWRGGVGIGAVGCSESERGARTVEGFEVFERNRFDVAADAAFGEGEGHPRLEMRDQFRTHAGVRVKVEIEAVGKGVHERAEPRGAGGVVGAEFDGVDEELHAQVAVEFFFTFDLGEAAEGVDVVEFDAVEVVFGLGVEQAENGVSVCLAKNVGDAPSVADDGDLARVLLPAGEISGRRRGGGGGKSEREENEEAGKAGAHGDGRG